MPIMMAGPGDSATILIDRPAPAGIEHPLENALQGLLQLQAAAEAEGAAYMLQSNARRAPRPPMGKAVSSAKTTAANKKRQAPKRDSAGGQPVVVVPEGTVSAPPSPPLLGGLQVPATGAGYGSQHNVPAPAGQAGPRPQPRLSPHEMAIGYPAATNPTGREASRGMRPAMRPPPAPMPPPQQHAYRPPQESPLPHPRPLQPFMPQSLSQQANSGYDAPPRPKPPANRATAPASASSPMASYPYPPPTAKPRPSAQAGARSSPPPTGLGPATTRPQVPSASPSPSGGLSRPVGVSSLPYSGQRKQPSTTHAAAPDAYAQPSPTQLQGQGQGQQGGRRPNWAHAAPLPSGPLSSQQPQGPLRAPSPGPPTPPYAFPGAPGGLQQSRGGASPSPVAPSSSRPSPPSSAKRPALPPPAPPTYVNSSVQPPQYHPQQPPPPVPQHKGPSIVRQPAHSAQPQPAALHMPVPQSLSFSQPPPSRQPPQHPQQHPPPYRYPSHSQPYQAPQDYHRPNPNPNPNPMAPGRGSFPSPSPQPYHVAYPPHPPRPCHQPCCPPAPQDGRPSNGPYSRKKRPLPPPEDDGLDDDAPQPMPMPMPMDYEDQPAYPSHHEDCMRQQGQGQGQGGYHYDAYDYDAYDSGEGYGEGEGPLGMGQGEDGSLQEGMQEEYMPEHECYDDPSGDDFHAQTLCVSIPTDSLSPESFIVTDRAQAHRLASAAANRASVSRDDQNSIINQEVMLVPSQVASPAILSQNQENRIKNLEKIPPSVVIALEAKLSTIPAWDVRITREKLDQLGGDILVDSSPVLMQGEKSEQVTNYAPRNFNIRCRHCSKTFHGKNALRNFELHAIFWELCKAHPSHPEQRDNNKDGGSAGAGGSEALGPSGTSAASQSATGTAADGSVTAAVARKEMTHSHVYPCNSVSRDVVVFMEAKKPILCNNQKKVWKLQGNLHHDTSLFQGRAWLQIPSGQSWESCKLADPTSLQRFLCCRANKTLEQYETLRAHVFTWHDSGVFTACSSCNRVYQNTRAFLGHGCIRKSHEKDEQLVSGAVDQLLSLVDYSPDFAKIERLSCERKQEVFDRVSKRLRAAGTGTG